MKRSGGYRYVVTLKNKSDLDDFYSEMESSNGTENIPNRKVQCLLKRPISRSTHYQLTDEEASKLKNDDRVSDVQEPYYNRGIKLGIDWDEPQSGNWDKIPDAAQDKNWALKRCIDAEQTPNWGTDGTPQQSTTVNTTSSGKNVDVVIVDEHINFDHPEFAVNPDGTGGSRAIQFNWFQYSEALGYNTEADYTYTGSGSHATHVAGTAAGNTQGWARDANIYNISFHKDYVAGNPPDWSEMVFDYIREFHKNKPINPATGRKNPTIVNNSWSSHWYTIYTYYNPAGWLVSFSKYRGNETNVTGTSAERKQILEQRGISVGFHNSEKGWYINKLPARDSEIDNDAIDMIDDGIIVVAAAGNSLMPMDVPGGNDYDNYINATVEIFFFGRWMTISISEIYPNRGASPGAAEGVICVGDISAKVAEYKAQMSNFEERVDVWAPGTNIMSSVYNSSPGDGYSNVREDPRNSSYFNASTQGTSMASPQIAGLLACLAEQWPTMNQADALQFLKEGSKSQVGNNLPAGNSVTQWPYEAFGDGNNRYVHYVYKRPQTGTVYPHNNYANRNENTSGIKYPRPRYTVTK